MARISATECPGILSQGLSTMVRDITMHQPEYRLPSCVCLFAIVAAIVQASILNAGDDVAWFRRDHGVAPDGMVLPVEFGEGDERLWRVELPPGISSPCLCGDSVFVTTYVAESRELATVALDRTTGQIRWKQVAPTQTLEPFHAVGSPASSTPACNGSQVFSFFGSYGLLCYDLNGKLLWERPMGPFQDEFGASSSPVLLDGKVILNEDHDIDSFLIALDQKTGEVVWKTPREEATRSYSTPVVFDNHGHMEILVAGSLQLTAYDPSDGQKLWWFDGLSRLVDSTPVVVNGEIYVATWTPGGDTDDRIRMESFAMALTTFDKNGDGEIGKDEFPAGQCDSRTILPHRSQSESATRPEGMGKACPCVWACSEHRRRNPSRHTRASAGRERQLDLPTRSSNCPQFRSLRRHSLYGERRRHHHQP